MGIRGNLNMSPKKTEKSAVNACSELSQSHQDKYLDLTDGHSRSLSEAYFMLLGRFANFKFT